MSPRTSFTHSYRARRAGMDRGTRSLLLVAGGLGALLVGAMGIWSMMGRGPATVPVIEADSRPVRVKPDNPGGMQVIGANEDIMGGTRAAGADAMAPAPEAPAPQALRAQMQPPAAPAGPAPAAPSSVPAPASVAAAPPPAPVAVAPAPPPTPAAVPAAKPAAAPAKSAGGGTMVQLAAFDNEQAAQAEWQRLVKRMPELLSDRRLAMEKAEKDGHPIWRVRTGGFSDMADATGFCQKVRAKGGACSIASF